MQLVGYRLIDDATQNVVREWGGSFEICPGVPNPVVLPNGDQVCGMSPDTSAHGYTLASWYRAKELAQVKSEAKARIDADAEAARLKYVTAGAGQALTYDRKRREALQAIDDPAPSASKYPVLSASIGIEVPDTGNAKADFDAISQVVISKELAWAQLAKAIEVKRLGAKAAIEAATTVEQVQAAAQVTWP